jgi:hypothetical protein
VPLYDIGDQIEGGPLTIYVTTDAGVAAAATVTCTITLPDGTTTSPSVTTSATGTYETAYAPAVAGTFYVKWSATAIGGVSGENDVFEDSFTVSASTNTFISLAEGKEYLNLQDTADDDELLAYLETACNLAETVADRTFARTTQVDTISSNGCESTLHLTKRPVLSVTTVTERGTTLTANTGYAYDPTYGHLYRMSAAYERGTWAAGTRSNVVTYVAGYAIIPPAVRQATLSILRHLWDTQRTRPGSGRPARSDEYQVPGTNWFIPNKARDVLFDLRVPLVG